MGRQDLLHVSPIAERALAVVVRLHVSVDSDSKHRSRHGAFQHIS
jgi:hypothetical protein